MNAIDSFPTMLSIKQLRERATELEEEADVMEVRRILGLASDADVTEAKRAAAQARRAVEQALHTYASAERHP